MSMIKKCCIHTRFLIVFITLLIGTCSVMGATLIVTKTADTADGICDSDCSLREAIAVASSGDTVTFDSGLFMTPRIIRLGSMLLIDKNLTIHGVGGVIIDGNNVCRVFDINNLGTATLTDMTITGGNGSGIVITNDGGAIINSGNLTLVNVTVTGNSTSGGNGGGIANGSLLGATMTIVNSTISDNSASGSVNGGGIYTASGSLSITGSTISGNLTGSSGGGVYAQSGTLTINGSAIVNNRSSFDGGGVDGSAAISNTTISGNRSARSGGGFYGSGTLTNATISNNSVADNIISPGGGIFIPLGSSLALGNSIVAGNVILGPVNPTNGRDIGGAFTSNGNNLVQVRNGGSGFVSSDLPDGTDPLLASLANNSGLSATDALQINSPAIDAGNNALIVGSTDQRGAGFARIVFGTVDIGAYEIQGPTAAMVPVEGKVITVNGRPINKAKVTISGTTSVCYAETNPFGFYRFERVEAGQTYIVNAAHRHYLFLPKIVNVLDPISDLNFFAEP